MPWNRILAGTAAGSMAGLVALAGRYAAGVARADREWAGQVEAGLHDLGEVDEVSVVPLVERLIGEGSGLRGEPGVSYLVSVGDNGCCSTPGYRVASRTRHWRTTPRYWVYRWQTSTPS